jgi:hypothetical protein
MSSMRRAGWAKITKVVPESWEHPDQPGVIEYAHVVIVADGVCFARTIRKGETLDGVAQHYRQRGWTDSECIYVADWNAKAAA